MKSLVIAAGSALLLAAPASAQPVHQSSLVHNGQTVALQYEPLVETEFRQRGVGPRSTATCAWKSRVSVKRTALDASGAPIAVLTRVMPPEQTHSGTRHGRCASMPERDGASFPGSEQALQAHVAQIAAHDAPGLRAELASLRSLGASDSYAR